MRQECAALVEAQKEGALAWEARINDLQQQLGEARSVWWREGGEEAPREQSICARGTGGREVLTGKGGLLLSMWRRTHPLSRSCRSRSEEAGDKEAMMGQQLASLKDALKAMSQEREVCVWGVGWGWGGGCVSGCG